MPTHTNFYENIKEANMRLANTVVLYDGKPYYILTITDHKNDDIFRVYMDEMGNPNGMAMYQHAIPYEWHDEPNMTRGQKMDEWLDANPKAGVIRKMMNSPKFNKFRPFPLGCCNYNGSVVYLERSPSRHTQQGLTSSMVCASPVSASPGKTPRAPAPSFTDIEMYRTIIGEYPSAQECLINLKDKDVVNTGAAFARNFSFLRGPVGLLFLAYKADVIGYLPNADFSRITIPPQFRHTKEVVEGLNLFEDIKV